MKFKYSVLLLLFTNVIALAGSSYITLLDTNNYQCDDIGTTQISIEGGFSVDGGDIHYWNSGYTNEYYIYDADNDTLDSTISGPSPIMSNGYGDPFGVYDSASGEFYLGTYYDYDASYLYVYSGGSWYELGSAVNMYGAAMFNGELYFSGLNEPWNGSTGQDTYISIFNQDDPDKHDCIVETAGNSAYLAFDTSGNLYYATYGSSPALYRWDANDVSDQIDILDGELVDNYLTLADATKLSDLEAGGNGIVVDDSGDVFVTINSASVHKLIHWNSTYGTGSGYNYETIATGSSSSSYYWFGPLAIDGSFYDTANPAPLYGSFSFYGPITKISIK